MFFWWIIVERASFNRFGKVSKFLIDPKKSSKQSNKKKVCRVNKIFIYLQVNWHLSLEMVNFMICIFKSLIKCGIISGQSQLVHSETNKQARNCRFYNFHCHWDHNHSDCRKTRNIALMNLCYNNFFTSFFSLTNKT